MELTSAVHSYPAKGRYKIAARVIDIFGNDTAKVMDEGRGGEGMTVKLIYENGVFTPVNPVDLPEKFEVEIDLPKEPASHPPTKAMGKIYEILSRRYDAGKTDLAERHNEHQP